MMQVAPILTKNQVALPKVHRSHGGNFSTGKATRQIVTSFPQKLYEIIGNPDTDHLIRWSEDGDSFSVLDPERFAHDILPYWFKHSNINSFVRQLNMYGFHKIPHLQQGALRTSSETQFWNFAHPSFQRGQPDLLCLITTARKRQTGQDDALQPQEKDTSRTSGLINANPNTMNGPSGAKPDTVIKYQPPPQEFDIDKLLSEWSSRQGNADPNKSGLRNRMRPSSIPDDQSLNLHDPSDHLGMDTLINNAVFQPISSSPTTIESIGANNTAEEDSNPEKGRKRKIAGHRGW